MTELQDAWTQRSTAEADEVALVLAESGSIMTFGELDRWAEAFLERHPYLRDRKGSVLAFSVTDPVAWLGLYLAALKAELVAMPIDSESGGAAKTRSLEAVGVSFYQTDQDFQYLEGGRVFEGMHLVKLTSGTSGEPQPLLFTEKAMRADGNQIMRTMGFGGHDCNYAAIPLGHSYGLGNLVMPWLLEGTRLVVGSAPVPQVIAEEVERYQCTLLPMVPPLLRGLAMSEIAREKLASLRLVVSAGSRLEPEIARQFLARFDRRIHNFYGSSETGGICFDRTGDATLRGDAVGSPLEGVSVFLDARGSVVVKSDAVCASMAEAAGARLHDFGRWTGRGELELSGRGQDFVKIGGKRLFLGEIERAICRLNGVGDGFVTHRPSRRGDVQIVALIQGTASSESVKQGLRATLPVWKIPKRVYPVETMLYNARGKKDRKALEALVDSKLERA